MESELIYHIYNHANGSENLFRSDENYRFFLKQWGKYIVPIADTYAYCLMPNHFHALVRIKSEEEITELAKIKESTVALVNQSGFINLTGFVSKQFSNMFNSYSKAYNKMYSRRGALFNRSFKAKEITKDSYLTNVIFYIHHNPVHHGFVDNLEGWPHSSFHSLISTKETLLMRDYALDWFGGGQAMKLFHNKVIKELDKLEMEFT